MSKEGEGMLKEDKMPFKSKAQQGYMFAKHPKIAKRFAKETPNMKSLPKKVVKRDMPGMSWHSEVNCSQTTRKTAIPVDQILSKGVKAGPFK